MSRRSTKRQALLSIFAFLCGIAAAGASAEVVTVQAISTTLQSQKDVPVTFGQIFKAGDVPAGAHLRATMGGEPVPVQVDRKATHADGSLRHAVITVVAPELPASATRLIRLSTGGDAPSGAPVTLDDLLATGFDAHVSLDVNGTVLTASARDLLAQVRSNGSCRPWGKQCNVWLSGPQVSEWIVGGPLQSSTGPNPHLAAYFYIRAYAGDPIHRVRVNVVIENDWTWISDPHNITYDATITVGSQTYQKADIEHYTHTRWHRVMWWHDKAAIYAKLNGQYIQDSRAVSQYADVQPADAFLDSVLQDVEPMGHGDQTPDMSATGAQVAIGPLPRWTAAYLLSTDQRAFHWMLANDDATGSYNVFYRDQDTGRPVSLLDYPYMTLMGLNSDTYNPNTGEYEAFPVCGGDCSDPNKPDGAHEPSIGYLSYIVTGDFYYLEQLQFWANWNVIRMNPHYRHHSEGLVKSEQVRGQAWELRALADAAYITPNDSPLKPYFTDMVRNNIAWYNNHYTDNPDANSLSVITNGYAIVYDDNSHHSGPRVRLAPWQDDFFTWTIGHLADLGFDGAERFLRWKARFAVARMTDPDFCWLLASQYTMRVRNDESSPLYADMGEIYAVQFPSLVGLECNSPAMLDAWGMGTQAGEMYGYADSPTGYPSNLQPALAAAVDSGIANSARAWQIFANRSVKPDYSNEAMFAVVPRSEAASTAQPPLIDFYASPNPVLPGASTTLYWNAVGATSCSGSWLGDGTISGKKKIGPVNGAIVFTIDCVGAGGSSEATVRVTDTAVHKPTIELTASPTTIQAGQVAVLSWNAEYADQCVARGGWSGDILMQGQKTVGPLSVDTDFEVACKGPGGDAERSVAVNVDAATPAQKTKGDEPGNNDEPEDEAGQGGAGALNLFVCLCLLGTALGARRRNPQDSGC